MTINQQLAPSIVNDSTNLEMITLLYQFKFRSNNLTSLYQFIFGGDNLMLLIKSHIQIVIVFKIDNS